MFAFQCQETTPTTKSLNTGAWEFIPVLLKCPALEKSDNFAPPEKFPAIRYTSHIIILQWWWATVDRADI